MFWQEEEGEGERAGAKNGEQLSNVFAATSEAGRIPGTLIFAGILPFGLRLRCSMQTHFSHNSLILLVECARICAWCTSFFIEPIALMRQRHGIQCHPFSNFEHKHAESHSSYLSFTSQFASGMHSLSHRVSHRIRNYIRLDTDLNKCI